MAKSALDEPTVRGLILQAWRESSPDTELAHEQGGFILRDTNGSLNVERWPKGGQNEIIVPSHPGGRFQGRVIVATFHTHPNPGNEFQQEPSLTDIRAVSKDPNLTHLEYEGEFAIATEYTYRIRRNGDAEVLGRTDVLLGSST